MLILKIILLSKILIANKICIANKISGIKNDDKVIKKFIKQKIRNLFKLENLKSKKLFNFQK